MLRGFRSRFSRSVLVQRFKDTGSAGHQPSHPSVATSHTDCRRHSRGDKWRHLLSGHFCHCLICCFTTEVGSTAHGATCFSWASYRLPQAAYLQCRLAGSVPALRCAKEAFSGSLPSLTIKRGQKKIADDTSPKSQMPRRQNSHAEPSNKRSNNPTRIVTSDELAAFDERRYQALVGACTIVAVPSRFTSL